MKQEKHKPTFTDINASKTSTGTSSKSVKNKIILKPMKLPTKPNKQLKKNTTPEKIHTKNDNK